LFAFEKKVKLNIDVSFEHKVAINIVNILLHTHSFGLFMHTKEKFYVYSIYIYIYKS